MLRIYITCAVLLLVAGAFIAGRWTAPKQVTTNTTHQVVTTVKPDGTTVVSDTTTSLVSSGSISSTAKPRYSLGIYHKPVTSAKALSYNELLVTAGIRVVGDLWAQIGYMSASNQAFIGVSYQW